MYYSHVTWTVVLFVLGCLLAGRVTSNSVLRLFLGGSVTVAAFLLEANNLAVKGYLGSLQHEPSIGLVTYCLCVVPRMFPALAFVNSQTASARLNRFPVVLFFAGLALYPMALGLGYFDSYALGYQPWFALLVSFVAAVTWWQPQNLVIAVWLTGSLLAHFFRVGESDNLFDYLLDPISFILALIWVTRFLISRLVAIRAAH